ncbi:MAG: FtsQ-type POTRA domain-containing protein [Clostridiales bacterium]|nr:FtsQ-type POTRA domain-containing protein [Clostridiales bacterium]
MRRRKIATSAALVALAGLAITLILVNWVFLVREVGVEGNSSIPSEEIIRWAKLPLGERLNSVDEALVKAQLESNGLVELLELRKRYPSEVVLVVRERVRDAVVAHAGMLLALEGDGTVVEVAGEMPDDAVYVTGLQITSSPRLGQVVGAPSEQLDAMKRVLAAVSGADASQYVSELNVQDANSIYIYSRTGMRVELGDASNMVRKVLWMAGALKDLESRGETAGRLDVSSGDKADYSPN